MTPRGHAQNDGSGVAWYPLITSSKLQRMTDESNAMEPTIGVVDVSADSSSKKNNNRKGSVMRGASSNNVNYYNRGGYNSNHNYHYHGMYGNRGYPYNHAAYEIDPQMREYYNHMAVQQM